MTIKFKRTLSGLSKRVRKKIYNDDYESKDVMDILEYIDYGVARLTWKFVLYSLFPYGIPLIQETTFIGMQ